MKTRREELSDYLKLLSADSNDARLLEASRLLFSEESKVAEVRVYGMYDCHMFCKFEGYSPVEIASSWLNHVNEGGHSKYGPASLCPASLLDKDGKSVRRVGKMVHADLYKGYSEKERLASLEEWVLALENDEDVRRLLNG